MDIKEKSFKRPDFESFLKHTLLPRMNPFPGVNSVLIVDNCSVHKGGNVQQLCDERDCLYTTDDEITEIYHATVAVMDDRLCYKEFKSSGYLV
ncbi:hypothetical protein H4Q26_012714 [Puccinia striiformis f. sp. tritici PST-130]|nr:hypothetical protein H4Q26_012714 [Puccinia striiformis f. sp. tritici PST-130]